jgi:hypothetical protein
VTAFIDRDNRPCGPQWAPNVDSSRPECANSGRLLNGEVEFAADSAERLRAEAKLSGSNPIWRAAVDENDKYVSPLVL